MSNGDRRSINAPVVQIEIYIREVFFLFNGFQDETLPETCGLISHIHLDKSP